MKSALILLTGLSILVLRSAAASPAESPATPTRWVSPQAQAVIARVKAAQSGIGCWTARMVAESQTLRKGVVVNGGYAMTERYLKSGGPIAYYAATVELAGDKGGSVLSQDLAVEHYLFRTGEKVDGSLSKARDRPPDFWLNFEQCLEHADLVHWVGRETLAGQSCDIVETVDWMQSSRDAPGAVTEVYSVQFYVNPAGQIERITKARDGNLGEGEPYRIDIRIAYDASAQLTPADFSRESFERDAVAFLKGRPMPELREQLFRANDSLPDLAFIGWADGKPFRVSDLKGKVVVLETWASWCHFCKEAFPFYEKTRQALADQGVVFVAVSFDKKLDEYEKWMKQHGGSYGFKFGRVDSADPDKAMKEFRGSLPAFYVLGRDGKVLNSYLGYGYGSGNEDPRLLAALRAAGIKI